MRRRAGPDEPLRLGVDDEPARIPLDATRFVGAGITEVLGARDATG
jgi:hypothetical protein